LAAQTLESDVAAALHQLLDRQTPFTDSEVAALLQRPITPTPELVQGAVSLRQYDQLLLNRSLDQEVWCVAA
jgi:hypothetical protein